MKSILLVSLIVIAGSFQLYAQDTITTQQVHQYLQKEVVLKGKIVHIKDYTTQKGDNMVFLDMDEKYPNNRISVAIYEEIVNQIRPEIHTFLGKNVLIRGIITQYRQVPSIELRKPDYIKLVE
jgi:DNA/RNA endonuclease YhcR with UshA esterase domain